MQYFCNFLVIPCNFLVIFHKKDDPEKGRKCGKFDKKVILSCFYLEMYAILSYLCALIQTKIKIMPALFALFVENFMAIFAGVGLTAAVEKIFPGKTQSSNPMIAIIKTAAIGAVGFIIVKKVLKMLNIKILK